MFSGGGREEFCASYFLSLEEFSQEPTKPSSLLYLFCLSLLLLMPVPCSLYYATSTLIVLRFQYSAVVWLLFSPLVLTMRCLPSFPVHSIQCHHDTCLGSVPCCLCLPLVHIMPPTTVNLPTHCLPSDPRWSYYCRSLTPSAHCWLFYYLLPTGADIAATYLPCAIPAHYAGTHADYYYCIVLLCVDLEGGPAYACMQEFSAVPVCS